MVCTKGFMFIVRQAIVFRGLSRVPSPALRRAYWLNPKLDLAKVWKTLKDGGYPWAKTAMRYWPRETLEACKENKSYRIAHGLG